MRGDEDRATPEFHSFIPFRIVQLHARLNRQAVHLLEKHSDLTLTQWRILVMLNSDDISTLSEMAETSDIDKGLLSRNLSNLVNDGLVSMETDPTDRRINLLSLTEAGRELHDRVYPIMTWRHERLMRDLTPEQAATLNELFDILENAISDEGYEPVS